MSTQQSRKRALSAASVSSFSPESKRSRESIDGLSSKNLHLHNTLNSEPVYDIPPSLPTLIGRNSSSSENTNSEINDQVANAVRRSGVGLPPNSKTSSPMAIQHSLVQSLQHDVSVSTSDDESTASSAESDEPVEVSSRLHSPGQHGPSPPAHIISSTTSSMLSANPSDHSVLDLSESNTISDYESDSPTSSSSSGYSSRASSPNMLPSLIPPLADLIPPQQEQHNLSRNSNLLTSISSFTAGNRPAEYAPPIHVGVHDRLMKFLPVIQAENETLEQERRAGRLAERNIENVDETGREYIEMV